VPKDKIRKVIICSGQVYYDILNARRIDHKNDVAIVRIEELHPFPYKILSPILSHYKNAEFYWC
jgi:2-oxoglutarate dehydrogenase E1 component